MSWAETIGPRDDLFHTTDGDPYWNESSFISFHLPERNLLGLLYFCFRPNHNMCMGGPIIWDHTGSQLSDCLYNAWDWHMPIPEGAQMFDCSLANGVAVQTLELQKSYRQLYEGPGCKMDVTFTATMKPHYMRKFDDKRVNPGMADYVTQVGSVQTGHYEYCVEIVRRHHGDHQSNQPRRSAAATDALAGGQTARR